jgi:DNA-binding XRE family transcriptional regulator
MRPAEILNCNPAHAESHFMAGPILFGTRMGNPTDLTDKHVGDRIRMRRLMLQMSQSGLGDAIGVTFQQVQGYEKGTTRISAGRL